MNIAICMPFDSGGCPHREAAHAFVLAHYATKHPEWPVVHGWSEPPWRKGIAVHEAVQASGADVLVIADADSVVPVDVLSRAVEAVCDGTPWVMPHQRVYRWNRTYTERVLDGGPWVRTHCERSPYWGVVGGGITVLSREAWDTVGGIDPRFAGWGGEDISFGWALQTLVGEPLRLKGSLFHLFHPNAAPVQRPSKRGCEESEALAGRYRRARYHPDAMAALVEEARQTWTQPA